MRHAKIVRATTKVINGVQYDLSDRLSWKKANDAPDKNIEVMLAQLVELREYIRQQRASGVIKAGEKIIIDGDFNILFNAGHRFQRAEFLLGEEGIIVQKTPNASALTIEFEVDKKTDHAELGMREFARQAQLHLSKLAQECAKPPTYKISEEDQGRINKLSADLDEVIKHHIIEQEQVSRPVQHRRHSYSQDIAIDNLITAFPDLKTPREYQGSGKSHFTQLFQNADAQMKAYLGAVKMEYDRLALSHAHGTKEKLKKFDEVFKKYHRENLSLKFDDFKTEIDNAAGFHRGYFSFFNPAFTQAQKNITFTYLHNLIELKISNYEKENSHRYIQRLEKEMTWSSSKNQKILMKDLGCKIAYLEAAIYTSFSELQEVRPEQLAMQDEAVFPVSPVPISRSSREAGMRLYDGKSAQNRQKKP